MKAMEGPELRWRLALRELLDGHHGGWRAWSLAFLMFAAACVASIYQWCAQRDAWPAALAAGASNALGSNHLSQPEPDFVQRSKSAPETTALLHDIQRECTGSAVRLLRFSSAASAAAANGAAGAHSENLTQQAFELSLQGTYPAIKQVLRAVAERHEQVTVHSLRLQRQSSGATTQPGSAVEVEAQVRLVAWGRPALPATPVP